MYAGKLNSFLSKNVNWQKLLRKMIRPILSVFTLIGILFVSLIGIPEIRAQENIHKIQILDAETNLPVRDAIVSFQKSGKKGKKGFRSEYTDKKGEVQIPYTGQIQIFIQQFGYKTYTDTINVSDITIISLEKLSVELATVEVSTAQYENTTQRNSVQEIRVIGRDQIKSQQAINLEEILSNQLNINVDQDPSLGSSLNIQGVGGQNIKILVDGIPQIGRQNGSIDLGQFNMYNVERIEIIEGPMAVDYGADALGGVVNIITKKDFPYRIQSDINLRHESVGHYNIDGTINYQFKNNKLILGGGRYFFDGYSAEHTSRTKTWKPREQYFLNFKYIYRKNGTELIVKSDHLKQFTYFRNEPIITPYEAYVFDDEYTVNRIGNSVFLNQRFENNSALNLIAGYSYFQRDRNGFRKDLTTLNSNALEGPQANNSNKVSDVLLRGTFSTNFPLSHFNQQIGFDAHHETGEGDRITEGIQTIGDYAIFTSFEYSPINSLTIRPGVRAAYNTKYGSPFIPSLNIRYDVHDKLILRSSIARGFRAPSIKELELNFVDVNHNILGNPNLEAELSKNMSLSLHYYRENNKDIDQHFESKFFYNRIDNLISLALVDENAQLYSYVNLSHAITLGYSLNFFYRYKQLKLNAGIATTGVDNGLRAEDAKRAFYYSPEYRANVNYSLQKYNLDFGAYFNLYGAQQGLLRGDNGKIVESRIDSYAILDFVVGKQLLKNKISLSSGIKNLLDVKNINGASISGNVHSDGGNSNIIAMGRNYFLALRINLYSDAANK